MAENLSLKSFVTLMRASRSVQEVIRKDIEQYGMNPTEFAVLELLYSKGEQPIQHIGKKILLASGSITYVVDKLEKKEFIARRHCEKDRRVIYAAITEAGVEFMDKHFPKHTLTIEKIFNGISDEEKMAMIELFKKIGYQAVEL